MAKRVLIIGAGISGLTAGIYAQKMGFESEIYEKLPISGGECTGWDRNGFHIDGCVHWLTGSKEGTDFGNIWRQIGAFDEENEIYQPDCFYTTEFEGVTVKIYSDLEKLRNHLSEISPEDKIHIDELCNAIKRMENATIPEVPPDMMNPIDIMKLMFKMSGSMKIMKKFNMSLSDYAKKFKHPAIKQALVSVLPADSSAYILPFTLGTICSKNGGRPYGGSRKMALRITEKYLSSGGKLYLDKNVKNIIVKDGKAVGIALQDRTEVLGDYILPATDIHVTLKKFLNDQYSIPSITMRDSDQINYPSPTCVYAAFGFDGDLSNTPPDSHFQTMPYFFEDQEKTSLSFKHYCYEPSFSPQGKSIGIVYLKANYDWWKALHSDNTAYREEKKRLSGVLCALLEERFKAFKGNIYPLDMATPITYERYCGAWRGSWMSYAQTPKGKQKILNGKIKGIKNLYMAGQWLMPPGGLPVAIITGKWAVMRICKQEKISWRW